MIITVALSQVLWGIAFKWRSITGGDDGIPGIRRPYLGMGIDLDPGPPLLLFRLSPYFILVFACHLRPR